MSSYICFAYSIYTKYKHTNLQSIEHFILIITYTFIPCLTLFHIHKRHACLSHSTPILFSSTIDLLSYQTFILWLWPLCLVIRHSSRIHTVTLTIHIKQIKSHDHIAGHQYIARINRLTSHHPYKPLLMAKHNESI